VEGYGGYGRLITASLLFLFSKNVQILSFFEFKAKNDAFRRKHPISYMLRKDVQNYEFLPMHVEFFIIGGGLTGSSIAYWIKQYCRDENITVTVLENTENVCSIF
jgi:hypothetical protein